MASRIKYYRKILHFSRDEEPSTTQRRRSAHSALQDRLNFNGLVRPACLPDPKRVIYPGERLILTGQTRAAIKGSEIEYCIGPVNWNLEFELFNAQKCDILYKDFVSDKIFCAVKKMAPNEECAVSNSGAPIFIRNRIEKSFEVVGVFSYGARNCRKMVFSLYSERERRKLSQLPRYFRTFEFLMSRQEYFMYMHL